MTKQPANALKGETDVVLEDGRTLRLSFSANTWIALEELSGKDMPEIVELLKSGKASMGLQRQMMFCGLQKHQPDIKVEEAGEILFEAASAMHKALTAGLPQGEGESETGDAGDDEEAEAGAADAGPTLPAGAGSGD
jgi:hypothetical protein